MCDSETDPFKAGRVPKPFLWGYMNEDEYLEFETTEEFVEHLLTLGPEICYAHNGGKFDFHFLLPFINKHVPITVINGRIAKAKIGNVEIRDSYCLITYPLSAYEKDTVDYAIFEEGERDKPKNKKIISKYLKGDCQYLYEIVTGFISEYGLHLTQATAAMRIWEEMSGQEHKMPPEHYEMFSKYYFGGRTQAFFKGEIGKPFSVYDIVSAYPGAMMEKHPYGKPRLDAWRGDGKQFVTINAKGNGSLPVRLENGGLDFPDDGVLRTFHITGWELLEFERQGGEYQVVKCYSCPFSTSFEEYVTRFFKLKDWAKKNADKMREIFAKIFLNALYGKFASNPENYAEFKIINLDDTEEYISNGWRINDVLPTGNLFVDRPLGAHKRRYYDVCIAASITGRVRAKLARVIHASGLVGAVYYCDTDSIACDNFRGDVLGSSLGGWELEAECKNGWIAGKKLYAFQLQKEFVKKGVKYKTASKGVKLSAKQIKEVAKGKTIEYISEAPTFSVKTKDRETGQARFSKRKVKIT